MKTTAGSELHQQQQRQHQQALVHGPVLQDPLVVPQQDPQLVWNTKAIDELDET